LSLRSFEPRGFLNKAIFQMNLVGWVFKFRVRLEALKDPGNNAHLHTVAYKVSSCLTSYLVPIKIEVVPGFYYTCLVGKRPETHRRQMNLFISGS
jgi:hypothetical protein